MNARPNHKLSGPQNSTLTSPTIGGQGPTGRKAIPQNDESELYWKTLLAAILSERTTGHVLSNTRKLGSRSHILVQAPDRDPLLGYEFANVSLNPTIMKSLSPNLWQRIRNLTGLNTNGAVHCPEFARVEVGPLVEVEVGA
eukprot:g34181.t1